MSYTNTIQFLGLILIVTNSGPSLDAILPKDPEHTAIIAYPADAGLESPGFVDWFYDHARPPRKWNYTRLTGETITFKQDDPQPIDDPVFLAHLNDDCCRMIGSVRISYLPGGKDQAANVLIDSGDVGWTVEGSRIDTVVDMTTTVPLEIIGKKNGVESFHLKFREKAEVVVANFDLGLILHPDKPSMTNPADHFKKYYRMVTFGFFCNAVIKAEGGGCSPHFSEKKKKALIITHSPTHTPADHRPGVEIECSNTQYP